MYEYIKGVFVGINRDYIILDNGGIGYKIYTSGNTMAQMPAIDQVTQLFVHQIVREDFIGLYGFLTKDELMMFNLLLTINGVGAKAALSLLSISSVDGLRYAIVNNDEKTITRAPGVGKKIAQRIILELKDKIKIENMVVGSEQGGSAIVSGDLGVCTSENYNKLSEAMGALISLGYTEKEAQVAIKNVDPEDSLEMMIKHCLKNLDELRGDLNGR